MVKGEGGVEGGAVEEEIELGLAGLPSPHCRRGGRSRPLGRGRRER